VAAVPIASQKKTKNYATMYPPIKTPIEDISGEKWIGILNRGKLKMEKM
jgi:hypothetical protein